MRRALILSAGFHAGLALTVIASLWLGPRKLAEPVPVTVEIVELPSVRVPARAAPPAETAPIPKREAAAPNPARRSETAGPAPTPPVASTVPPAATPLPDSRVEPAQPPAPPEPRPNPPAQTATKPTSPPAPTPPAKTEMAAAPANRPAPVPPSQAAPAPAKTEAKPAEQPKPELARVEPPAARPATKPAEVPPRTATPEPAPRAAARPPEPPSPAPPSRTIAKPLAQPALSSEPPAASPAKPADKPPGTTARAAEKPAAPPAPSKPAAEKPAAEDSFAALLKSVENQTKRVDAPTTRPGAGSSLERPVSDAQRNALIAAAQRQMEECWQIPAGVRGAERVAAFPVNVKFAPDGRARSVTLLIKPSGDTSVAQIVAESAQRAAWSCQLTLPPELYPEWQDINFTFDPRQAVAG